MGNERGVIYKRILKVARTSDEDNKHHFDLERRVAQFLHRIASTVNHHFISRSDVAIWPVETIQFEYGGKLSWATVQPPFIPDPVTNNKFVKIEPNSGDPEYDDPIVGRYQHLFAAISRGLYLVRDWQGYGVSQEEYLSVCKKYNLQKEIIEQIKIRKNKKLQTQTQVFIVIDPVLTSFNAHFETGNATDFGIKGIDEWKDNHDCVRCRCQCFHLLSTDRKNINKHGMLFGIADQDQLFFDKEKMDKKVYSEIMKCRHDLNIWCGDDAFDEFEKKQEIQQNDENLQNDLKKNINSNNICG